MPSNDSYRSTFGELRAGVVAGRYARKVVPLQCAVTAQLAAALLDDSVDGRQPEARTLARVLGREERLVHSLESLRIHTHPVVGNGEEDPTLDTVRGKPIK